MNIKTIKELVQQYSAQELESFADTFEQTGTAPVKTSEDPGDQMSDYLQAMEVRNLMDSQGMTAQAAVREFSKRVRSVLE